METSFEYTEASLLCAEEDSSIFYDEIDNCGLVVDDLKICKWKHRDRRNHSHKEESVMCHGGLDLEEIELNEERLGSLVEKETQHLPALGYLKRLRIGDLDLGARNLAIQWIEKAQSHYNFGPLCVYLAINYLDRFLSAYDLPKGKDWMMQLQAVACLSLAAKMEETEVPSTLHLQVGEAKIMFEAKTIQRMELLVLSILKWRMQAVTPFSFIDSFLKKSIENKVERQAKGLILQCIQLILSTIKGIEFLEFRPSEIAAAVVISVTEETQMTQNPVKAFPFLSQHVQRERVVECVHLLRDLTLSSRCKGTSGSVPHSPIGVLDAAAACMSEDASTPSASSLNSLHNTPAPKRRKLARTLNLDF